MIATPVLLMLAANVGLGGYLALKYWRGERGRPMLVGLHLILAFGVLETTVVAISGTQEDTTLATGRTGPVAAGLVAVALFAGLISAVLRKRNQPGGMGLLIAHGGAGIAALLVFAAWMGRA